MRRKKHFYQARVFTVPLYWKHGGRIVYPCVEITRMIRELEIVGKLPGAEKWCG